MFILEKGLVKNIDNIIYGELLHSDVQDGDRRYQHLAHPQLPVTTTFAISSTKWLHQLQD